MEKAANHQSCMLQSPPGIDVPSKIAQISAHLLNAADISRVQAERFTPLKGGRVNDPRNLSRDALQGIFVPFDWLPDGAILRFSVPDDKPGTPNGWCAVHPDGIASSSQESSYSQQSRRPKEIKLNHPEAEVLSDHCSPLQEVGEEETDSATQWLGRTPPGQR
jgi:hypothetical protein